MRKRALYLIFSVGVVLATLGFVVYRGITWDAFGIWWVLLMMLMSSPDFTTILIGLVGLLVSAALGIRAMLTT